MKWLGQYIQDLPSTFRDDVLIDRYISSDGAETVKALYIDFDRTVPGSGTATHRDVGVDIDVTSASLGASSLYGMDIDVVGATSGTSTAYGIHLDVDGADTNIGMVINTAGTHLKLEANADADDYATFTVADTGDLTIATIGDGTTDSDLTLDVDGDITLDAAGQNIVATSDQFNFNSANANDPLVLIKNSANDATSGRLRFLNERGADGQDNDETGIIEFFSYDDGTPTGERYARIIGTIHDATTTEESGKLSLQVASHDGGDEDGLVLTGGSVDAEVDVTIGNGVASLTTVTGNLVVSGSTVIKVLPKDFMANEDGGANKSILYDDTGTLGVRTSSDNSELYAFVEIPFGKAATSVIVYGNDASNVVEVFEADINASGLTDRTPGAGCVVNAECDMDDVEASTTNYLAIRVTTTTAVSDIVYGAAVTVAVP